MKTSRFRKAIFIILTFVLVSVLSFSMALTFPCEGIANTQDVKVRAKSSTSAKVIAKLKKGDAISVQEEIQSKNGDVWYRVETAKGKTGYILSDFLSIAETDRIQAAQNSDQAAIMYLTVNAHCSDYNGVGKNWTQYFEWNGIQVQKEPSFRVTLGAGIDFTVYSRIREQDKKPDTGMEKTIYSPTAEELSSGFTVKQTLRIAENTGKSKGNIAEWTVEFVFTPVQPEKGT